MGWQRECHGCRDRGIDCGPHHTTTPSPSSNASIKVVLLLPIREAELPRLCCLVLHLHWYSSPTGVPPFPYVVMPQFQPSTSSSHSTACPSSRRGTAKPLGTLASLQLLVLSWLPLTTPSLPPPSPLVTARICVLFSRLFLAVERSFFPPAFTALCPLSRGLFPAPLLHSSLLPLSPIRKRGARWEGSCKP